ncbi:helix-turn-helix transcriptional regulator [bacterium]|nr:helix-turn-helix transcriptional regulator [bacterium]
MGGAKRGRKISQILKCLRVVLGSQDAISLALPCSAGRRKANHHALYLVEQDSVHVYYADSGWQQIQPGEVLLVRSGVEHVLADCPRSAYEFTSSVQPGRLRKLIFSETGSVSGPILTSLAPIYGWTPDPAQSARIAAMASRACEAPGCLQAAFGNRVLEYLLIQLVRDWLRQQSDHQVDMVYAKTFVDFAPLVEALERSPFERWGLQRMAELANMSRSSFAESFRRRMECSPMGFVAANRAARRAVEQSGQQELCADSRVPKTPTVE